MACVCTTFQVMFQRYICDITRSVMFEELFYHATKSLLSIPEVSTCELVRRPFQQPVISMSSDMPPFFPSSSSRLASSSTDNFLSDLDEIDLGNLHAAMEWISEEVHTTNFMTETKIDELEAELVRIQL